MQKGQIPVFAVTGWEHKNIKEHNALVLKLHYTKPDAIPGSEQFETPILSLTSVQLTAFISTLQAKLSDLQNSEK